MYWALPIESETYVLRDSFVIELIGCLIQISCDFQHMPHYLISALATSSTNLLSNHFETFLEIPSHASENIKRINACDLHAIGPLCNGDQR